MITLSDKSAEEIVKQSSEKGYKPYIRIGVRGGGCTGFTLFLEFVTGEPASTDLIFSNNGAFVIVDPKSYIYLEGSVVDYKYGVMERGFKIDTPRAKGACGCGESLEF